MRSERVREAFRFFACFFFKSNTFFTPFCFLFNYSSFSSSQQRYAIMKYFKKLRNNILMQNIAQQSGSAALLYGKFNALNVGI